MVPARDVTSDGHQLGTWLSTQRANRDGLTGERCARLEALEGWGWEPYSSQWDKGFDEFAKYVAKNGSTRVPQKHVTSDGYNLGTWVATQRANKDNLAFERRAKIEALNGWVWKW